MPADLVHIVDDLEGVTTELHCLQRLGNLIALEGPDDVTVSALKLEIQLTGRVQKLRNSSKEQKA
jgi:hypothetical protein